MQILLLDCNKVSKECFDVLEDSVNSIQFSRGSLSSFEKKSDILTYSEVSTYLNNFLPFDAVVIADIFWPTGQNICRWSKENNKKCFFWQHGQWIYTKNKKNPKFLPTTTFLLGDNIMKECNQWPYGKRSKLMVSGSPRYDHIDRQTSYNQGYVYFSPPVVIEKSPSAADHFNYDALNTLKNMSGLDNKTNLLIHPHYREGYVDGLQRLFPKAHFSDPTLSSIELIGQSRKVLTHRNSTAILDAIACGKQTVIMNLDVLPSFYLKGYFGDFALESDSVDHCLYNLNKITELPIEYENEARKYIYLGNASHRMLHYVLSDV